MSPDLDTRMQTALSRSMVALFCLAGVAIATLAMIATASSAGSDLKEGHGLLTVQTSPHVASQVMIDGVQRNTSLVRGLELPAGSYTVCFGSADGYLSPPCEKVGLTDGRALTHVGEFHPAGTLAVTTEPSGASGMIIVDGVARDRGAVVLPVLAGEREVCFGAVDGYEAPACETVTVPNQGTTSVVGPYVAVASDGDESVDQDDGEQPAPTEGPDDGTPPAADDGGADAPEARDGGDVSRRSFHDVPEGVHRDAILRMAEHEVIRGHPDGTFRPASPVTRGQVAALLTRAFRLDGSTCAVDCVRLADIDTSTHAEAIRAVVGAGVASGYHDGTFGPDRDVTREQIASMLAATLGLSGDGLEHPFDDIRGTRHEASIAALHHAGITQGSGPTSFSPREPMRRDQYASLLDRSLDGS